MISKPTNHSSRDHNSRVILPIQHHGPSFWNSWNLTIAVVGWNIRASEGRSTIRISDAWSPHKQTSDPATYFTHKHINKFGIRRRLNRVCPSNLRDAHHFLDQRATRWKHLSSPLTIFVFSKLCSSYGATVEAMYNWLLIKRAIVVFLVLFRRERMILNMQHQEAGMSDLRVDKYQELHQELHQVAN